MAARPRRRPLSREEALALQQRRQHQREMEEESRELARGPIDLPFLGADDAFDGHRSHHAALRQFSLRLL